MTPPKYPDVSVIICTYNRPDTLRRAIDSVIAQTYKGSLELVVVYDGPPDPETIATWDSYKEEGFGDGLRGRLKARPEVAITTFGTSEPSSYYCVPRNAAIGVARGDYIMHLDDDNALAPRAVEVLMQAILEGVVWPDMVYGRINYCFEEGASRTHNGQVLPEGLAPFQPWDQRAHDRLAAGPMANFIDSSSFLAAKGAYWRLYHATEMMFNEGKRRFGDWELITRAVYFAEWRGKAVDERVVDYYWGTKGQIQLNRAANEQVTGKAL